MTFEEKIQNLQDVKCIYEEIVNTPNCVIGIEPCEFDQLFDNKEGDIEAIRISVDGTSENRMEELLESLKTNVRQDTYSGAYPFSILGLQSAVRSAKKALFDVRPSINGQKNG